MVQSNDKVGYIEALEKKIVALNNSYSTNKTGYWDKLSKVCDNLSADQLKYIENDKNVIQTKNKMMETFSLFLFEKFKEDFATNEICLKLCDDYIDAVVDASNTYSDKVLTALEENENLKLKIQQLEKQVKNENSNPA